MFSGEHILMKGKAESRAILAANAVFPLFGAPAIDYYFSLSIYDYTRRELHIQP
jgi:hypothetical protein